MSDLLSKLVARSLPPGGPGPPGLLRPRLPSWFEAAGGMAEIAAPRAEPQGERSLTAPKAVTERDEPPVAARPRPTPGPIDPPRTIFERLEREIIFRAQPAAEVQLAMPPENVATQRAETAATVVAQPMAPSKAVAPPREPRPREASRPMDGLIMGREAPIPDPPILKPVPVASPGPANLRPAAPRPEPMIEPRPAVKIHIGRIDVRAVHQAPAPRAKPVSPAPKMTLDDYLRQRNEGKR
jgi:hypothetical protein